MPVSQLPNLREVGDGVVGVNFIDGNLPANQNQLVLALLSSVSGPDHNVLSRDPGLQGPAAVEVQVREAIALPLLPDQIEISPIIRPVVVPLVQNPIPAHLILRGNLPGLRVDFSPQHGEGELIPLAIPLPVIVGDCVVGRPAEKAKVCISVKIQVQNLHSFFWGPACGVVVEVLNQTTIAMVPLRLNGLSGKNRLQQVLPVVDPLFSYTPVVLIYPLSECLQHQRSPIRQRSLHGQEDMVFCLWNSWRLFHYIVH